MGVSQRHQEKKRLFIAIEVSSSLSDVLADLIEKLRPRFEKVDARVASLIPSFELQLKGVSSFRPVRGEQRSSYPIWVGVEKTPSLWALKSLVEEMEQGFELYGFAREKRGFVPHLTLARVKETLLKASLFPGEDGLSEDLELGRLKVSAIGLFESQPFREG